MIMNCYFEQGTGSLGSARGSHAIFGLPPSAQRAFVKFFSPKTFPARMPETAREGTRALQKN
jgi:hypothetical protein